jgi:hypothetical protein
MLLHDNTSAVNHIDIGFDNQTRPDQTIRGWIDTVHVQARLSILPSFKVSYTLDPSTNLQVHGSYRDCKAKVHVSVHRFLHFSLIQQCNAIKRTLYKSNIKKWG